ncbi:proline-rich receptor-like protein kinase PERK2 [Iris pallida]|uniref:Proline-rich receptor-like protein kinase PERK2 n=1 Tax=Iris pallida TaxID=29817 RepID=A0AAX6I492_IRIPA|nr:proline-rich receptor-like protein kinase PERK2 [Iris pallida]
MRELEGGDREEGRGLTGVWKLEARRSSARPAPTSADLRRSRRGRSYRQRSVVREGSSRHWHGGLRWRSRRRTARLRRGGSRLFEEGHGLSGPAHATRWHERWRGVLLGGTEGGEDSDAWAALDVVDGSPVAATERI